MQNTEGSFSRCGARTILSRAATLATAVAVTTAGCGIESPPEETWSFAQQALTATVSFQNGVNAYTGTTDTELRQVSVNSNYGATTTCNVDGDDGGGNDYSASQHDDDTWWASYAGANRWLKNGVVQAGSAGYGALFIRFNVSGDPRRANAYFKDVNGRLLDEFTIFSR